MTRFQNHIERIAHFGIAITMGMLTLTACAPQQPDPQAEARAQAAECIVAETGAYVAEYGSLSAETWVEIHDDCTAEAGYTP